jgi:hypothetical protein
MHSLEGLDGYKWSPDVEGLAGETFTQGELSSGLADLPNSIIVEATTRLGMFMVSDPVRRGAPGGRRFHYYDAHALMLYALLAGTPSFPPASRRKLTEALAHLLLGDPVSVEEALARKAETAADYERAARSPVGRAKFGGRMLKVLRARQIEIRADPRNASPFWWNRSADINFFVFACDGGKLVTILADRNKTPNLDMRWLESIGARQWFNATRLFCGIDAQLMQILEHRNASAEPVEAE